MIPRQLSGSDAPETPSVAPSEGGEAQASETADEVTASDGDEAAPKPRRRRPQRRKVEDAETATG